MIPYLTPACWIQYDRLAVAEELVQAKAAVLAQSNMPLQKAWADRLQVLQLKREVAGTSRIEGAEFSEPELEAAMRQTPEALATRSQRQAAAAAATYRWIAGLPDDRPLSDELVREIHRRLITGADDDHCPPGRLRQRDENVSFGIPRLGGVPGGADCESASAELLRAARTEYAAHDPLIQALAEVRAAGHDLTAFLRFGLRGVALQCGRLLAEIRAQVKKALFRDVMLDLFGRLESPRKRVMARRQVELLRLLLERDAIPMGEFLQAAVPIYAGLKSWPKIFLRDIFHLKRLGAMSSQPAPAGRPEQEASYVINLDWPTQITETEFFERVKNLAKARRTGRSLHLHP